MSGNNDQRTFVYQPRWKAAVLGGLLFAACGVFWGVIAATNEQGLILNGIFEFSPEGATAVYWMLCGLSAGLVAMAAVTIFMRLTLRQKIILASGSITAPKSRWSSQHLQIQFEDIEGVQLTEVYGQRFAIIFHPGGKATIAASMLPGNDDFDDIVSALSGIRAVR